MKLFFFFTDLTAVVLSARLATIVSTAATGVGAEDTVTTGLTTGGTTDPHIAQGDTMGTAGIKAGGGMAGITAAVEMTGK